jgi:glycosyltransferase involved in cell wall biosynthesis
VSAIHQFVPMLHRGDAVGRHTLRLREVLAGRGIESRIYVELVDGETASEVLPYRAYEDAARAADLLVYQFATASGLAPWLGGRGEPLVVNYHNVTPPEHYAPWDNALARHQLRAQGELRHLAGRATLGLAVSAFNEAELRAAGFARTAVVPPADMLPTAPAPDRRIPGSAPGPGRWLTVGRLAPNKAIEDILGALAVTREHHDPGATLDVVGRSVVPAYTRALLRHVAELGLGPAVRFVGPLSDDALGEALATADVLVVASRHEGFGVPVLEAMSAGRPVVANDAGALPEVVGDGGLLVDTSDPYRFADAVERVRSDASLRGRLASAASRRVGALDLPTAADRAADLLVEVRTAR